MNRDSSAVQLIHTQYSHQATFITVFISSSSPPLVGRKKESTSAINLLRYTPHSYNSLTLINSTRQPTGLGRIEIKTHILSSILLSTNLNKRDSYIPSEAIGSPEGRRKDRKESPVTTFFIFPSTRRKRTVIEKSGESLSTHHSLHLLP